MKVSTQQVIIPRFKPGMSPLATTRDAIVEACGDTATPLRVAVVGPDRRGHSAEIEAVMDDELGGASQVPSIFEFRRRERARTGDFNAVMLIPTGIDCAIGGHAGDATPAARLLGSVVDNLVLHPNVVNASDINEGPSNGLYVEGSLICRLMMGTIGLRRSRGNRVLLVTENRPDAPNVVDQTINCAEGARATLGVDINEVVVLEEGLLMKTGFTESGRVTGHIERINRLMEILHDKRGSYDAVALATRITPHMDTVQLHRNYFGQGGANPWGGVEAVLTHLISTALDVPAAHAPTMSSEALRSESWGVVEPRKAAEIISTTYLFCVLKGLHQAPRVETIGLGGYDPSLLCAEDISALVIPDGVVGLPTLAAIEQGIPVIAVRNNKNLMRNDLRQLPFRPGQLLMVENYYEAAGMLAALRAGVPSAAVLRPMTPLKVSRVASHGPTTTVAEPAVRASKPKANGKAHANGSTNGHANGLTNGHAEVPASRA